MEQMWHKLALRLGRTVAETKASVTIAEFKRWMAFDRISPIGDERFDVLFARQMQVQFGGKLSDYHVEWYQPPPTPELMAARQENATNRLLAQQRLQGG